MSVAIDGDALRTGELAGAVPVLAKRADEGSFGIEFFDPMIQRVADVKIAVFVDRDIGGSGEVAGGGERVVLAWRTNFAQQFEGVGVDDQNLVRACICDLKKTIFFVDGHIRGIVHHAFTELTFQFVVGTENQHMIVLSVGDKKAICIVDHEPEILPKGLIRVARAPAACLFFFPVGERWGSAGGGEQCLRREHPQAFPSKFLGGLWHRHT